MPRTSTIDRIVMGVDAQTFFALACGSDTYAACHGGDHPGGMLDVRVGAWTPLERRCTDTAAVAAALKAAHAGLAGPKKVPTWRSKKGGAAGEEAPPPPPPEASHPDPAAPAVRALAYRMPPDWGDGWMTKLAPAMNIEEGHVCRGAARPAAGGELDIETSIKWSRLAPAAVVMKYTMAVAPAPAAGLAPGPATRVHYAAVVDTAALPLPPPVRAVIETSMEASFQALVAKFIAFAADRLGGAVVDGAAAVAAAVVPPPPLPPLLLSPQAGLWPALSPRAAASPRVVGPPPHLPPSLVPTPPPSMAAAAAGAADALWAACNPEARHWRLVDTEGAEYWDAAEALTPREAVDSVWAAGGGAVGVV